MVGNEETIDGKEGKSWVNLFSKYYGGTKIGEFANGDTIVIANIFSFLRSGDYNWTNGNLDNRARYGAYWSVRAHSDSSARYLAFDHAWLHYQNGYGKGHGFSLRKSQSFCQYGQLL